MAATDDLGITAFEIAVGISAFSGNDVPLAFLEAGARLPPETINPNRETYADNPRILDILARAGAVEQPE